MGQGSDNTGFKYRSRRLQKTGQKDVVRGANRSGCLCKREGYRCLGPSSCHILTHSFFKSKFPGSFQSKDIITFILKMRKLKSSHLLKVTARPALPHSMCPPPPSAVPGVGSSGHMGFFKRISFLFKLHAVQFTLLVSSLIHFDKCID